MSLDNGLIRSSDGNIRCDWPRDHDDYLAYHDDEWGMPVSDDFRLFEKICLEGFQSGLSWLTILRKRENFRHAFAHFDFHKVARFDRSSVEELVQNEGIVRHRGKIESTIRNAQRAIELVEEFGSLATFLWRHEPPERNRTATLDGKTPSQTAHSQALSKNLKQRGWSFVGPTTMYAFMQATGMVNDHLDGCAFRSHIERARATFQRPA
ncbi:MAG: DNA-3-methyladenine glycosylase I [Verrucomicrobiota bacterium]